MARPRPALLREPLELPPRGHALRVSPRDGAPVAVSQVQNVRDAALDAFGRRHPGVLVTSAWCVGRDAHAQYVLLQGFARPFSVHTREVVEVDTGTLRARVLTPEDAAWFMAPAED